ncbi:two-component system response regulator [Catenovulum sp. SM1970]|uniref:response regulator n=1 Tax=Marinifaba aquimaris TaxID=2741323 RepID=UPI001573DE2F|nr:two-component system response regulator [Marinifaba aquimaris]NTS75518.1 two-component system response regulator [Marinifaba aquimaris]
MDQDEIDQVVSKQAILVVDDNPENIHVLTGILRPYYKVKAAINGELALKIARGQDKPDIILLDIMMPGIDGYEVCSQLKASPETSEIPVIFVTAKSEVEDEKQGFLLGAVDYITKPVSPSLVLARVSAHLKLYDQKLHLESLVQERTRELEQTRMEIIESLGRAAEFKDNETGMHVIRMSWYSRFLAQALTENHEWSELLFNAAPMHDIGKIGIPDRVLLKPGKLDEEEWAVMKKHVDFGVDILGEHQSSLLKLASEVAQNHHEKWDGSGYPNGLKGEEIPLSARIVAVADVFDALTSERPYKKAWSIEEAMDLLEREAGSHFDPQLIPLFKSCLPSVLEVKEKYQDDLDSESQI